LSVVDASVSIYKSQRLDRETARAERERENHADQRPSGDC
jgi:hypothetical protein